MTFSEKLKLARKESNMTQEEVAQRLGVTRATYSRYELGQREPNVEMLKNISNVFNVSVDFLVNENKYNKDAILNSTEKKLLKIFRELNKQGQDYIVQTIDMAKDKYTKLDNEQSDDDYITTVAARGNSELSVKLDKKAVLEDLEKPMSFDD